jgi:hypothetical protein
MKGFSAAWAEGRTKPVAARGAGDGEVDGPGLPSPPRALEAAPRARKAKGANTTSNTDAPEWWEAERPEVNATHVAVQSEDAAVRLRLREIFGASVRQAEAEGMPVACLLHPLAR